MCFKLLLLVCIKHINHNQIESFKSGTITCRYNEYVSLKKQKYLVRIFSEIVETIDIQKWPRFLD